MSILQFLKWKDDVIAKINSDFSVDFIDEKASLLANPDARNAHWSAERFAKFLDDRIISRQRRDIEKILFRCGLSSYDTFKIAERTKAINAKDLFWVTDNENDLFNDAITDVFESVFIKKVDKSVRQISAKSVCSMCGLYCHKLILSAAGKNSAGGCVKYLCRKRVKIFGRDKKI